MRYLTLNTAKIMHPAKARLVYEKFDTAITAKYGVVIERWPPGIPFRSPGDMQNRVELETLFASWQSDTTRFVKLTPNELQARLLSRVSSPPAAQATLGTSAAAPAPLSVVPIGVTGTPGDHEEPIAGPSSLPAPPLDFSHLNAGPVAPGTQTTFSIMDPRLANKTRAPRSDKGKKRGPNKRTKGRQQ